MEKRSYNIKIICNIFEFGIRSNIRMNYRHLPVFMIFLLSFHMKGQDQVFLPDSITVEWRGGTMAYQHTVAPKETLYSLCRKFNTGIDKVYESNPDLEGSLLSVGQQLWVPAGKLLVTAPVRPPVIRVYYSVQKGETLFRIAKIYLQEDVSTLMARNGLENTNLRPGQKLLIGWLPGAAMSSDAQLLIGHDSTSLGEQKPELDQVDINLKTAHDSSSAVITSSFESLPKEEEKILSVRHTKGVAYQIRSNSGGGKKYFALHNQATPDSYIEITNPMFNTVVLAKVIGKIPEGMYPDDIDIIVSPSVAKDLHVLDRRFYVELKYLY